MVARVTWLIAEKFVLSTFPRALTTLSSMCSRAVRALESSPGLIMMMDNVMGGVELGRLSVELQLQRPFSPDASTINHFGSEMTYAVYAGFVW